MECKVVFLLLVLAYAANAARHISRSNWNKGIYVRADRNGQCPFSHWKYTARDGEIRCYACHSSNSIARNNGCMCKRGYYRNDNKNSRAFCVSCPNNYYTNRDGAEGRGSCSRCSSGMIAQFAWPTCCSNAQKYDFGQQRCVQNSNYCELGLEQSRSNRNHCVLCRPGFYRDSRDKPFCKRCPGNYLRGRYGAASVAQCNSWSRGRG